MLKCYGPCKQTLPPEQFHNDKSRPARGGKQSFCIKCCTARKKAWAKKTLAANGNKLHLKAHEYGGSRCSDCGFKGHHSQFDFDHVNTADKSDNVSKLISQANIKLDPMRWWPRIKAEIDKCHMVCANCHRLRTHVTRDHSETIRAGKRRNGTTNSIL